MKKVLMLIFLIIFSIILLVLNSDISIAQENLVKISVRQIGSSTYFYKVSNLSNYPIASFMMGWNCNLRNTDIEESELTVKPTDIESPIGWSGETTFVEESEYLHVYWESDDKTYEILPSTSLDGFIIYMPEPYDLIKQVYSTVIYSSGNLVKSCAKVQIDTSTPILYNGKGQKHSDVNTFLSYLKPLQAHTTLSDGKNYYYIFLFYGQTIMPETFKAELNGKDITNSFHPKAGESDAVKLNFKNGKNTLALIIDGKKSNGKRKTDIDRFVFIVQ